MLLRLITDSSIAGVYGPVRAMPDAYFWEKVFSNIFWSLIRNIFLRRNTITRAGGGVLGNTNSIIRRDLWEQHNFDNRYGLGGEDEEWADYWLSKGYKAVRDLKFGVYHSHYLNLRGILAQLRYWRSLKNPQPFKFPEFRTKFKKK